MIEIVSNRCHKKSGTITPLPLDIKEFIPETNDVSLDLSFSLIS